MVEEKVFITSSLYIIYILYNKDAINLTVQEREVGADSDCHNCQNCQNRAFSFSENFVLCVFLRTFVPCKRKT